MSEGRVYKEILRKHVPEAVPFYPLGMSDVTNSRMPLALGMRSAEQTILAVWRVDGPATAKIPLAGCDAKLLYPTDLGIGLTATEGIANLNFPRTRMGCLVAVKES